MTQSGQACEILTDVRFAESRASVFSFVRENPHDLGPSPWIMMEMKLSYLLTWPALMLLESAFIDAMRESPDDLGLRLVYADWLDEAGDSRGELVRLQCELDQLPLGNPRRQVLHEATRDLCATCQSEWLAPLERRLLSSARVRFHFGLVENVEMSAKEFLEQSNAGLFEEMPYLLGVWLTGTESQLATALSSPAFARIQSLKLTVYGSADGGKLIERLLSFSTLRNLTSLDLSNCHFGDQVIAELLNSRKLRKLRRLNLQNNSLTWQIACALRDSPTLPRLEMLALGSAWDYGPNLLSDWGIRDFTTSLPALQVRWLDLSANDLSDSSAWDLAQSGSLNHIECLYLGGNTFGKVSRTALEARFPGRVFYARCEPERLCQEPAQLCGLPV